MIGKYFKEKYSTGSIAEKSSDENNIPLDKDSSDNDVLKSNEISAENCHRFKILSSEVTRRERCTCEQELH